MLTMHHRSPLLQGGLEIPIQVAVTMEYSTQNIRNDTMHETMVTDESVAANNYSIV